MSECECGREDWTRVSTVPICKECGVAHQTIWNRRRELETRDLVSELESLTEKWRMEARNLPESEGFASGLIRHKAEQIDGLVKWEGDISRLIE